MHPFWLNRDLHFVVAGSSGWTSAENLEIRGAELDIVPSCFPELQYVRCIDGIPQVLSLLPVAPNLRGVDIGLRLLSYDQTKAVANAFRQMPLLREASLRFSEELIEPTRLLFDSLRALPFTSLQLTVIWAVSSDTAQQLCSVLQTARCLSYFQFSTLHVSPAFLKGFCDKLREGQFASKELRVLKFNCSLSCDELDSLLSAIPNPKSLDELSLITEPDVMPALSKHFSVERCCMLRVLSISGPLTKDHELFEVLKKTRLHTLGLSFDSDAKNLLRQSGLLDEGWLTRINATDGGIPPKIKDVLFRNRGRHMRCSRTCLALIAMRKKKRMLLQVPLDVVLIIVRYLWDVRNKQQWDDATA